MVGIVFHWLLQGRVDLHRVAVRINKQIAPGVQYLRPFAGNFKAAKTLFIEAATVLFMLAACGDAISL